MLVNRFGLEISGTKLLSTLPTHMWLSFDAFIFFHIMNQYCVIGVVNNDIESQFVSPVVSSLAKLTFIDLSLWAKLALTLKKWKKKISAQGQTN